MQIAALFLFLQIFFRRLLVPFAYIPVFIIPFRYHALKYSNIFYFYIFYGFYSIFITTDIFSSLIYLSLFLLNSAVYSSIVFSRYDNFLSICSFVFRLLDFSLKAATAFSIFLLLLRIDILTNPIYFSIFNPLNSLNMNAYIYIVFLYGFLSLSLSRFSSFFFSVILLLLTDSRTSYVLLFSLCLRGALPYLKPILQYSVSRRALTFSSILLAFISIFAVFNGFFYNLSSNLSSVQPFISAVMSGLNTSNSSYSFNSTTNISSDSQRVCLTYSSLMLAQRTFPYGTGIGLGSYQNALKSSNLTCDEDPDIAIRSHNFYISYFAEMGILFFVLLCFLLFHIQFSPVVVLGLLISFMGQEYITSPYVWMLLGVARRFHISK